VPRDQREDQLSQLTYKGKRLLKKYVAATTVQVALDDRERKENEAEVLRSTLTATDQALINKGEALLTRIDETIALANNNLLRKISPSNRDGAIKCFQDALELQPQLWSLPILRTKAET
jgi:hypothetical protein